VGLTAAVPIALEDTYGSLATRLWEIGGDLLVRTLDLLAGEQAPVFAEQGEAGITYAEKISPEDRLLDPGRAASELERTVRALHPHIGALLALADGTLLGVRRARDAAEKTPMGALTVVAGRLLYGARDRALELLEVQPPGGRPMDAAAYLRGHAR
jgi:methionyl-tRNA formyltransferase